MICPRCRKRNIETETNNVCNRCWGELEYKKGMLSKVAGANFKRHGSLGVSHEDEYARRIERSRFHRSGWGAEPSLPKFKFMERDE